MTAALHHEPTDPPTLPVVPVAPAHWDAIARTLGAVVELDPRGGAPVVVFNGAEYVAAVAS